jgi:FAD:protein FMN transferase
MTAPDRHRRVAIPLDGLAPAPPADGGRLEVLRGDAMGTSWAVTMVAPRHVTPVDARRAIEARLARVIAQMSTWEPASDLCRFNAAAAGTWHTLPAECFAVVACALRIARDTDGAYDPTVGPLVDLWGFGPAGRVGEPPASAAIAAARARTGWSRVALDAGRRAAYQPGGVALDLSSIAKGFAVDEVAGALDRLGATSHLVEIGGELRGTGIKPDGSPWWVALERPPGARADVPAEGDLVVALHGRSIATSGDHVRGFQAGGRWYAHTIDPRTGAPVSHSLAMVTVVHPDCMLADAFATALMVLGARRGLAYATQLGLAAVFVERDDELVEHMTPRFAAMLD